MGKTRFLKQVFTKRRVALFKELQEPKYKQKIVRMKIKQELEEIRAKENLDEI